VEAQGSSYQGHPGLHHGMKKSFFSHEYLPLEIHTWRLINFDYSVRGYLDHLKPMQNKTSETSWQMLQRIFKQIILNLCNCPFFFYTQRWSSSGPQFKEICHFSTKVNQSQW
jgi:hypothetical protein